MYVMIKEHYQFITLPLSHHSVTDKYFYITSLDDNIMMQSQNSHSFCFLIEPHTQLTQPFYMIFIYILLASHNIYNN